MFYSVDGRQTAIDDQVRSLGAAAETSSSQSNELTPSADSPTEKPPESKRTDMWMDFDILCRSFRCVP